MSTGLIEGYDNQELITDLLKYYRNDYDFVKDQSEGDEKLMFQRLEYVTKNFEIDSVENSKNYLKNLNLSTISLDFYSGLLTALEKGQELGLNLDLKVIDTQNDFLNIGKIISTNSFENYDFIIGPLIPRNINQFSIGIIKSNGWI